MIIINKIVVVIMAITMLSMFLSGIYGFVLQRQFTKKYLPNAKKKLRQILPVNRNYIESSMLIWPTNTVILRTKFFNAYKSVVGATYRNHKLVLKYIPEEERILCRRAYVFGVYGVLLACVAMGVCLGINYLITTYFLH